MLTPIVAGSARKHGVTNDDMLHAFDHPVSSEDLDDGFVMLIGPDRSGNLLEIGVVTGDGGPVIVHAMPARPQYLRRGR